MTLELTQTHKNSKNGHGAIGRNHSAGKQYNRALLLRLILQQGPMSRLALSRLTKLSPAALTILTGQLLEEGRIIEAGEPDYEEESGRVGRRSTLLDLNPMSGVAIGVHIAPRAVRVGLVDLKGKVRAKVQLDAPSPDAEATLDAITSAIPPLLKQNKVSHHKLLGAGVGAVGLVQHERGVNLNALSLQWRDVPIRAELEDRLNLPVIVDNNARTMALAEHLFGRGAAYRAADMVLVYAGAGIGGGVIIGGQPYRGTDGAAGEIGHVRVVADGQPCYCGGIGCLETVVSEASLLRRAGELAQTGKSPFLAQHADNITRETLLAACEAGDAATIEMLNQAGVYLGIAVSGIARVLNPQTVVLAGPLLDPRLPIFERVQATARTSGNAPGGSRELLPASLGEDIGILGGAALVLYERVFSSV
jgi:N-acetylglucosamine repressor